MAMNELDLKEWAHHPVTENFLSMLRDSRQETMEQWAAQVFSTELSNAAALGGLQVLERTIEKIMDWRELQVPDKA